MANPLARVVMDQMSKKNGTAKTHTCSGDHEGKRNLDAGEEKLISGVIHGSRQRPKAATGGNPSSNHRGNKVSLKDLVEKPPSKSREPSGPPPETGAVKDPYHRGGVKTSVIANPGKGVSSVALKSLGKGNR